MKSTKKTSLHFKIAAWTIKNKYLFYILSLSFLILAMLAFYSIGAMSNKSVEPRVFISAQPTSKMAYTWKTLYESYPSEDVKCVHMESAVNGFRRSSCYRLVQNKWVFLQNY